MTDRFKINLSLLILVSLSMHAIVMTAVFLPDSKGLSYYLDMKKRDKSLSGGRDIIVNLNQDNKRNISKNTLLSDKDSTARGYITKERGDRWLNNSLEFKTGGGKKSVSGTQSSKGVEMKQSKTESEMTLNILKKGGNANGGNSGLFGNIAIPDRNGITMKNAIYYNSSGLFSFNTAKFRNFAYFKSMKDKIASNWYPPPFANSIIRSYNSSTGSYTPGFTRIMAIPPQKVKLYFIMDRNGDVKKVNIVDSYGNGPLDDSCLDAIRLSRNFGRVPDDIRGEYILIPFIFGYYVQ